MTGEPGSPQAPSDDGLLMRDSGPWAKDKLAIVACYLNAFARACSRKAQQWYFVDGFAGPGINKITQTNELVWGSPLLGLKTIPPFHQCVFMDYGRAEAEALRARTAFAGSRATVALGDVNSDLVPLMGDILDRRAPCLCLLDPEGTELKWTTIEGLAGFRRGPRKAELLILLPTNTGFIRMLPLEAELPDWAARQMTSMYGDERWRDIWLERRAGKIESGKATTEYVRLYAQRLRELGYSFVLDREIRSGGRHGQLLYFLIFATDHDAGERIMDHCFDTAYGEKELTLFKVDRAKRLP